MPSTSSGSTEHATNWSASSKHSPQGQYRPRFRDLTMVWLVAAFIIGLTAGVVFAGVSPLVLIAPAFWLVPSPYQPVRIVMVKVLEK